MSAAFKLPPFGKFADALNPAGVETRTASPPGSFVHATPHRPRVMRR
jgi:hypothetical protein